MSNEAILVFARRPEFGLAKTRLEACIGKELTYTLYRAFLSDTLTSAKQSGARTILAYTPGPHFPEQGLADDSFQQRGATFAERFDAALTDASTRLETATPLIIVGADTPHLSPKFLRSAFSPLERFGAVIGPNINGGFYLLGFSSRPVPVSRVFARTHEEETSELLRVLHAAGVSSVSLDPQFDVDTPEDLAKLIKVIEQLEVSGADWTPQHTRDVLREKEIIALMTQSKKLRP